MTKDIPSPARANHARIAIACALFTAMMVGAAYASVPLYTLFCRVTGFGGATVVASAAPGQVTDRAFDIRFDANVHPGLGWSFHPEATVVPIRAGEVKTVYYRITNNSPTENWGLASYNVMPALAGAYFSKIQCFCFSAQKLKPGESLELPIVFFVDPAISDNEDLASLKTITLSYTFFQTKPPATPVAAAESRESPKL